MPALIGTYFNSFDKANKFCLEKMKRSKQRYGIISYGKGHLVLTKEVYLKLGLPKENIL